MATELERQGCDLDHPLWSAHLLLTEPQRIQAVHRAYAEAGADVLTTATYQLSRAGLDDGVEMAPLFAKAVALAREGSLHAGRRGVRVWGSLGPFGATLRDGSEYRGGYSVSHEALVNFHRPRLDALNRLEVDAIIWETLPSLAELEAIVALSRSSVHPWIVCLAMGHDHHHLASGEPLDRATSLFDSCEKIVGWGFNCFSLPAMPSCRALAQMSKKSLVLRPNGNQGYSDGRWSKQDRSAEEFRRWARARIDEGAKFLGGCCRTTPEHIAALAASIEPK